MKLDPYLAVDDVPFSATIDDVHRRHGVPRREAVNEVGLLELDYGHVVYRFQESSGRLEEVTARAAVLHLPGGIGDPTPAALAAPRGGVRELGAARRSVGGAPTLAALAAPRGGVRELGAARHSLVAVPFASLAAFVREHDADTFRAAGFFVSPRFGVAFDPADSNWVTALAEHCLPQWRALRR